MSATVTTPSFELVPQGDYSLEESARFIGSWHEAPAKGKSAPGHLHLAFLTDAGWMPAGVCLLQDAAGKVLGDVYGEADVVAVRHQVARILSLDVDGRGWPEAGRRDPVVGRLQRRFPGFRPVNWSDAYEAAAWCILSTRIAMRQAQGLKDRLCRELGHDVDIHGHHLWTFPDPSRLAELKTFRGLFGRKAEYLNALGRAALAGRLDTEVLRALPRDEAVAELKKLPGIGEFGSQLVRLRALSAVDELPATEPRLLAALREAYGLDREPDMQTLEELAEAWRPYRMWVCVCLRRMGGESTGTMRSTASG
ncbi:MAG TPA: DNA-3-methyladenine glycosylase 2 family protein [Candidatus Dormibacteraeota bacterium]|nr:DNA-3-methyladenine glycosylase 2 family protein [Candidatus Dormibacteraeota bacterium]